MYQIFTKNIYTKKNILKVTVSKIFLVVFSGPFGKK